MNQSSMKSLGLNSLWVAIFLISVSCQTDKNGHENEIAIWDTLSFASGLQYYYLKHGEGREIATNAEVKAYMKLYVNGNEIWSTDELPDSAITFIQGHARLIEGSLELFPKLKEGDEVVAIMPDSIAYGPEGSGEIPPGATLVFNPIIVKEVSVPKKLIADTLYTVINNEGVESAINTYHEISKKDSEFHTDLTTLESLMQSLTENEQYEALEEFAIYFENLSEDESTAELFGYHKLIAFEQLGKYREAIDYVEKLLEKYPENDFLTAKMDGLQSKLDN